MQLAFPIASVLWIGRLTPEAIALTVAYLAAFAAHEPVLVLTGRRGVRRRETLGPAAGRRLAWLTLVALAAGAAGLVGASVALLGAVGVTLLLGAGAMVLAVQGRERNVAGEVHAALSLVSIALPVGLAAGLPLEMAARVAGLWAASMTLGTVAARGVLIRKKDRGRLLRGGALLAVGAGLGLGGMAWAGLLSPWLAVGPAAFAVAALALSVRPPSPERMTSVGFGLVGASTVALVAFGWVLA